MNETTTEKNIQTGMREAGKGVEHVKELAANASQSLSNATAYVRQKAEDVIPDGGEITKGVEQIRGAVRGVAHNVSDAASYVRHKADNATTAVGGAMEDTGHYLRDDGINRIATDLTNLVRRNPIPAVLAGVAVGFLLAQATHRRGDYNPRTGDLHG